MGRPKLPPVKESSYVFTRAGIAEVFGVSQQRISHLVNMGMPQEVNGNFDVRSCVRFWSERIRTKNKAEGSTARDELVNAQKERIQLEISKTRGEVIPRVLVEQTLNAVGALVSTQLDGMGARLAGEFADCDDPQVIQARLFSEAREVRLSIANRMEAYAEELSTTNVELQEQETARADDDNDYID